MSNLTDLEICKRVAEIEGVKIDVLGGKVILDEMINNVRIRLTEYNPITDDALWVNLILKHEVSICFITCSISIIRDGITSFEFTDIPSLKRNALLLIIEAHKEQ